MHKKITHSVEQTSGARIKPMRTVGLVWVGRAGDGWETGGKPERPSEGHRTPEFLHQQATLTINIIFKYSFTILLHILKLLLLQFVVAISRNLFRSHYFDSISLHSHYDKKTRLTALFLVNYDCFHSFLS